MPGSSCPLHSVPPLPRSGEDLLQLKHNCVHVCVCVRPDVPAQSNHISMHHNNHCRHIVTPGAWYQECIMERRGEDIYPHLCTVSSLNPRGNIPVIWGELVGLGLLMNKTSIILLSLTARPFFP